jgi:hypothetical protein
MTETENIRDCDYEHHCTPLFKAIEEATNTKDFGPVLTFCESNTWHGAFFTRNEGSPAEQAGTWVTKYVNGKVNWSQLPLHLALVCGAPYEVIVKLVELYPAALKCTDDQHMLPLHLALRYDADDATIDFLLEKFPDAVNAKGKNKRTAVECALRSGNEIRGRILNVFVEKTKSRLSSEVINERSKLKKLIATLTEENEKIFGELETQYGVISKLNKDLAKTAFELDSAKKDKEDMEEELLRQVLELETANTELETEMKDKMEKLSSKRMVDNLELQIKIDELQAEKKELEKLNRMYIQDESKLRSVLASIQDRIVSVRDLDDWAELKADVDAMQSARIVDARKTTKDELEILKGKIDKSLNSSVLKDELRELKASVEKLRAAESTVRTSGDVDQLRNELHQLRQVFKNRSDTSKLKLELVVLKKAMETELINTEGKTKEQIEKIRRAIRSAEEDKLEHKTVDELTEVREELENVKKMLQDDELIRTVKQDVEAVQETLSNDIELTDGKDRAELENLKRSIDLSNIALKKAQTRDELIAIKKEVAEIKEQMKKRETTQKLLQEAASMRKTLEQELKKSEGRTQKELEQIKKEVKGLIDHGLQGKDSDDLAKMKIELETVRTRLNDTRHATKTQEELKALREQLAMELSGVQEKTLKELNEVKKAIKSVDLEHKQSRLLKKELTDEIKTSNAKAEKELLKMKKKIDALNVKVLESKQKKEWEVIRKEMETLKSELNEKQTTIISQQEQELAAMKKVMDTMKLKNIQRMHQDNVSELQEEMVKLKEELHNKERDSDALKQEIKGLQKNAKVIGLYVKKREKKGLKKKMFARGEASKIETSSLPMSGSSPGNAPVTLQVDSNHVETFTPREVPTILPPSLSNTEHSSRGSSSSDSDENNKRDAHTNVEEPNKEEGRNDESSPKKEMGKPPKAASAKGSRETISGGGSNNGMFSLLSIPMRSVKTAAARLTGGAIAGGGSGDWSSGGGDHASAVKNSGSKESSCAVSKRDNTVVTDDAMEKPVEMRRTLSKTIKRTGEVEIESIDVLSS